MTTREILRVLRWKPARDRERLAPAIGDGGERPVETVAELLDDCRQRIREVLVLATAETVARHHHAAPERARGVVEPGDRCAVRSIEQLLDDGMTIFVEPLAEARPVEACDARRDSGADRAGGVQGSAHMRILERIRLGRILLLAVHSSRWRPGRVTAYNDRSHGNARQGLRQ